MRPPDRHLTAGKLSGGNLQKMVVASELVRDPQLIVAVDPTAGLDVGATEDIHKRLLEERGRGKAILLISSDLDEIMALSDRIAVMYRGRITGVVAPEHATAETMGLLMAGLPVDRRGGRLVQRQRGRSWAGETAFTGAHGKKTRPSRR